MIDEIGVHDRSLRQRAEEHLKKQANQAPPPTDDNLHALLHELQVYKIELEMQNEELRRAQGEAEEQRRRYQDLFDFAPIGYVTLDGRGMIVESNIAAAAILGRTRSSVIDWPLFPFFTMESRGVFEAFLRRVRAGGTRECCEVQLETTVFRKRWLLLEGVAFPGNDDESITCRIGLIDISERKWTEEALKDSEEKLLLATTAAAIGMWHWNLVSNELTWDARCKALFDYPADCAITYEAFLGQLHEADRKRINAAVHKALQEKGEYSGEMRVVLPSGEVRWIMSKGRGYYDRQGEPLRMHGVVMDITERKLAEEEIIRLNGTLAARALELEAANCELEAFNYTVAHDLRKPLTVVNGYCQALIELYGDILDDKCLNFIQGAFNGTLRMNRLVDVLLNFSRMARVEPHKETLDLSGMVRNVASELQAGTPERRVTVLVADDLTAEGDANLVRVVLDNLLGNAWKYTSTREEAMIEFGAMERDGGTAYFVRDNGSGFDMADSGRLFIPFQRLPGSDKVGGHGIGLATVERIIRRHGGQVWAEGKSQEGATFWFTLPSSDVPT